VVSLTFQRCSSDPSSKGYSPNVTCADNEEFNSWFKKITVQEIIISNYVDTSDFEKPIHYFLDDLWVSLTPGRSVIYQTYIKKNVFIYDDDYFGIFNTKKSDYFYQRSHNEYFTSDDKEGPGEGEYFSQDFKVDKEYDIYER
jgi:hypothetical protein